eukprot:725067_1
MNTQNGKLENEDEDAPHDEYALLAKGEKVRCMNKDGITEVKVRNDGRAITHNNEKKRGKKRKLDNSHNKNKKRKLNDDILMCDKRFHPTCLRQKACVWCEYWGKQYKKKK